MFLCCVGTIMYNVWWFVVLLFFFKQKTAYEMRISDGSSDVCSSDLHLPLTVAAFLIVAFGWFLHLRKVCSCGADGCEKPARGSTERLTLLIATAMIVLSALWSFIEQPLMRALGGA